MEIASPSRSRGRAKQGRAWLFLFRAPFSPALSSPAGAFQSFFFREFVQQRRIDAEEIIQPRVLDHDLFLVLVVLADENDDRFSRPPFLRLPWSRSSPRPGACRGRARPGSWARRCTRPPRGFRSCGRTCRSWSRRPLPSGRRRNTICRSAALVTVRLRPPFLRTTLLACQELKPRPCSPVSRRASFRGRSTGRSRGR